MKFLILILSISILFITACSRTVVVKTETKIPYVKNDVNVSDEDKEDLSLSLFRLANYTNTPKAGMRAANILEGTLRTKGFDVISHIAQALPARNKAREIALSDGSKYFIYGGVSEWRYRTGIDGKPAVSIMCNLYKTDSDKLIWSATGAYSNWGNSSISLTAQNLFQTMLDN
jgi:hypothetical protein